MNGLVIEECSDPIDTTVLLPFIIAWVVVHSNVTVYSIWSVGTTANILGLLLMSVDHFVAIKWSLKHNIILRRRVVTILITGCWIFSILSGMLYHMMIHKGIIKAGDIIVNKMHYDPIYYDEFPEKWWVFSYKNSDGTYFLKDLQQQTFADISNAVKFTIIGVVFITLLLIYGYIASVVLKAAKERHHRLRYSLSSTAKERSTQMRSQKAKGLCTTSSLLLSFALLWAPFEIYSFLSFTNSPILDPQKLDLKTIEFILMIICSCTAIVDFCIYFLRSHEVVKRLREIRRNRCMVGHQTELNVAIKNNSSSITPASSQREATTSSDSNIPSS